MQTTVAMSELRGTPTLSAGDITATPLSTGAIAAAPALPAEGPGRDWESGVAANPVLGGAWPTLSIASILPCISVASFLGVLLLAIALPVLRKRGR